jgi:secondary thiamine-phosphate synthase enzyme
MKLHVETIEIHTKGRGFVDVTESISKVVQKSGVKTGLATLFLQHTSASLLIQENADPSVLRDLLGWFEELAPESRRWEHDAEGPDDMPSHARAALTRTSENIPIQSGRLSLGTWQAVYLFEHRRSPHHRKIVVHLAGEA